MTCSRLSLAPRRPVGMLGRSCGQPDLSISMALALAGRALRISWLYHLGNALDRPVRWLRRLVAANFGGAFRRSELVALNVDDLEETPEGLLIAVRRGKTDQEGLGRKVAIPRGDVACPVEAVKAWREAAGITEGALFRRVWNRRAQRVGAERLTARIVAEVVKAGASRLALDPATFGAHSLRSGLVTTAVKRGVNLLKICDQTGHKSLEMLRIYCRDAELFVGNAAAGLL